MTDQQPPQPAHTPHPSAPGHDPYPVAPASVPTKTMAAIALVCAILGFLVVTWIAAIVLAIIVLSQSRPGKGLAAAALIIAGLWAIALAVAVVVALADGADRDSTGTVTDSGKVNVTSVRVGDCIEDDDIVGEENYSVDVVPCSEPHLYEAYANFDLEGGAFPGDDAVSTDAEDGCAEEFITYIGMDYDSSELDITYLYPLEESWSFDKGVTCLVTDGSTTGSLKGANR